LREFVSFFDAVQEETGFELGLDGRRARRLWRYDRRVGRFAQLLLRSIDACTLMANGGNAGIYAYSMWRVGQVNFKDVDEKGNLKQN
jgi:hypothetical protein